MNNLAKNPRKLITMVDFVVAQRILLNMNKPTNEPLQYNSPKRDKVCIICGQPENWCSCDNKKVHKQDKVVYKSVTHTNICSMCGQLYQLCNC